MLFFNVEMNLFVFYEKKHLFKQTNVKTEVFSDIPRIILYEKLFRRELIDREITRIFFQLSSCLKIKYLPSQNK